MCFKSLQSYNVREEYWRTLVDIGGLYLFFFFLRLALQSYDSLQERIVQ